MTIRKGEEWGTVTEMPDSLPVLANDRDASLWLESQTKTPDSLAKAGAQESISKSEFGITGGAVWRMLGSPKPISSTELRSDARKYSFDVIAVQLDDGDPMLCLASVVLQSRTRRRGALVTNVADWRGQRVASKGHPNDGMLDTLQWDMTLRDVIAVWQRCKHGTALPHPNVKTTRGAEFACSFDKPVFVDVDGVRIGKATSLTARVLPDFCTVYA